MHTGRPEHLKTFSYTGVHRYSLTFCTHNRRPLFEAKEIVDLVLSQISRAATENQFEIVAYCFMPDHLHLLVAGTSESSDCKRFIARGKQYSGYYYAQERHDSLWQRYGFEHVLRDEEVTMVVARYIVENPVRGGLVSDTRDYPFVGSLVHPLEDLLEAVERSG